LICSQTEVAQFRSGHNGLDLEAERHAIDKWGVGRGYTYVDPKKIRSRNPGYCYKVAGWRRVGVSKSGQILLAKDPITG